MEVWKKECGKAFGERGVEAGNGNIEHFLEWNRSYMHSLENKVASLANAAENDHRSVGAMVDNLLDDAKRLVMLPFATLLEIFPKMVRDLSRDQGKEVELNIHGREIEIDNRILDEMKEAVGRANFVITGLMDLSSPRELGMCDADLNTMIENALAVLRDRFEQEKIVVNKELAASLPACRVDSGNREASGVKVRMMFPCSNSEAKSPEKNP